MEILSLLNKALWITAIIFALYWLIKYLYNKFKPQNPMFFYFHSAKKNNGVWKIKIEAPSDDFEIEIKILERDILLAKKKARLKAGLNNVSVNSEKLKAETISVIKIQSDEQKLERIV